MRVYYSQVYAFPINTVLQFTPIYAMLRLSGNGAGIMEAQMQFLKYIAQVLTVAITLPLFLFFLYLFGG
jgi:hypothetical protein